MGSYRVTYGLVTAVSYRDIPRAMRTAARMYKLTSTDAGNQQIWNEHGDPQEKIWIYAATLLEQSALQLEMRISELKPARARLSAYKPKLRRERLSR